MMKIKLTNQGKSIIKQIILYQLLKLIDRSKNILDLESHLDLEFLLYFRWHLLVKVSPEIYSKYVTINKQGKKVLYVKLKKGIVRMPPKCVIILQKTGG